MTTILFAFISGLVLSLLLTPAARWLGTRLGAVDVPSERNVHTQAIPRSGGLAIAASLLLALIACTFLATNVSDLLIWNRQRAFGVLGGIVVFTVGFYDDFKRLEPRVKLLAQVLAASLAYYGGVRIEAFTIGETGFQFGILSWFITVFWFLLLINAVNLIDGLDGLAAGVACFASTVMVILTIMQENYLAALEFAALTGVLLGFLRYNFNPASIFMGDGGSYFIGYMIATIAILGSIKSQLGATLLIPLLALGVPIFDTLLSPVRRWVRGQEMFRPDKGHIHHRLVEMGLSSKRAVLIIYGISCVLCLLAILLINLRNETASLLLIVLGVTVFIIVRKMGYLEYLAVDKIYGWFRDLSDQAGLSRDRRSFLSLQIEMDRAKSIEELWGGICRALEMMRFDRAELYFPKGGEDGTAGRPPGVSGETQATAYHGRDRRQGEQNSGIDGIWVNREENDAGQVWVWVRGQHRRQEDGHDNGHLRVEIPMGNGSPSRTRLILVKNLSIEPIQPYTLRRVEYLRRSVMNSVKRLQDASPKKS